MNETDLSKVNIDSLGTYKTNAFSFPVGAGVKFKISERCALQIGTAVHFISSDLVDNISAESKGNRSGDARNDKMIYTSVSFRYDLSAPRETPKRIKNYEGGVDLNVLDNFNETKPKVKQNVQIPDTFKPVDEDKDGTISVKELNKQIEAHLSGKSAFSKQQVYQLIEFYYSQFK